MSKAYPLRPGDTAEDRKLVETTVTTAAPTASDNGWATDGSDWIHIYMKFPAGVTECRVIPWYYSEIAEDWYASDEHVFNATTKFSMCEHRGSGDHVYFQVTAITGAGTVEIWAARAFDGRSL